MGNAKLIRFELPHKQVNKVQHVVQQGGSTLLPPLADQCSDHPLTRFRYIMQCKINKTQAGQAASIEYLLQTASQGRALGQSGAGAGYWSSPWSLYCS